METGLGMTVLLVRILAARSPAKPICTFIGLIVGFAQLITLLLLLAPVNDQFKHWSMLLAFPFLQLSVQVTVFLRDNLAPWPSISAYLCTNCTDLFLWTFLLSCSALLLTFSTLNRAKSYSRLSVFNSICIPDAPLAVSALFCQWSSGESYWNATFSFATSMQWTVFSLIAPAIFLSGPNHARFLCENEYKDSFYEWEFMVKGELVAVVYFEHFASVWFQETPGLRVVLLVFMLYVFKKLQEIYWPYRLREANVVAEDCFWSAILAVVWRWVQQQWILYLAVLLPCRQLWLLRTLVRAKQT